MIKIFAQILRIFFTFETRFPEGIILTCLFTDLGNTTRVMLRIVHPYACNREKQKTKRFVPGWDSSLACLEEHFRELVTRT